MRSFSLRVATWIVAVTLAITGLLASARAAPLAPGDLVVSEFLADPVAVSDTAGEWFEIFNTTASPVDLNGLSIADDGSNLDDIDGGGPLLVPPGGYFLLARNDDPAVNGGVVPDYVYSGFSLSNGGDEILILHDGTEIFRLVYDSALVAPGVSTELIALPDTYALTPGTLTFGAGDVGTPGVAGSLTLASAEPDDPGSGRVNVSAPGAAWLMGTGLIGLLGIAAIRRCGVGHMRRAGSAAVDGTQ